jgi:hypothetical protein
MPFVAERQFIIATRDTGYRTASAALAELVDNAIQAQARSITILTRQIGGRDDDDRLEVAIVDDGHGMDPDALTRSLRFGGTERFDDRSGLGRFGMGLPNSSVSQARRVDVYSWRAAAKAFHSYLDVDEISSGLLTDVVAAERGVVPEWASIHSSSRSGTAVIWSKCDRISAGRVEGLRHRLRTSIGRAFRYFLWDGVQITVDGTPVTPIDPLLCRLPDGVSSCASELGRELVYEVAGRRGTAPSKVRIRFSLLPVSDWSDLSVEDKRRLGISKGAGVSVVRAGREVARGWFFMGQKRKENYDDWWRCEVRFEPELDELFGVTHSKQDIRPTSELGAILAPSLEAITRSAPDAASSRRPVGHEAATRS